MPLSVVSIGLFFGWPAPPPQALPTQAGPVDVLALAPTSR